MSLGAFVSITLREGSLKGVRTSTYRLLVGTSELGGMTKTVFWTAAPSQTKFVGNQHRIQSSCHQTRQLDCIGVSLDSLKQL